MVAAQLCRCRVCKSRLCRCVGCVNVCVCDKQQQQTTTTTIVIVNTTSHPCFALPSFHTPLNINQMTIPFVCDFFFVNPRRRLCVFFVSFPRCHLHMHTAHLFCFWLAFTAVWGQPHTNKSSKGKQRKAASLPMLSYNKHGSF